MQRRDYLAFLTAVASPFSGVHAWAANVSALPTENQTDKLFSLGVASGSPTTTGMVLWTRLMGLPTVNETKAPAIEVSWEIAEDASFKNVVQQGKTLASPDLDYSVHIEPQNLKANTWYFYRFMVANVQSQIGRTRTLPLPGDTIKSLRLAYASCQNYDQGFYCAWRHMQQEQIDAVLFLGDYIYEYPSVGSLGRNYVLGWAYDLASYRERYNLYKSDPDLKAMHAKVPWIMTWDDHEVQNDYAGDSAGFSGPFGVNFAQRKLAAHQAYYENMPISVRSLKLGLQGLMGNHQKAADIRIYQSLQWGQLARLNLLDCRQYKDPQPCTILERKGASLIQPSRCEDWSDTKRSLLGGAQEKWLEQQFQEAKNTSTVWNILGQSSLFGQRNNGSASQPKFFYDGWDAYAANRQRIIDQLEYYQVPNSIILGGDVHENWVGYVKKDYQNTSSNNVALEFCGTSISSRAKTVIEKVLPNNPHFVYANSSYRGYGIAHFETKKLTTTLKAVEDVKNASSGAFTLAQFEVAAGSKTIVKTI